MPFTGAQTALPIWLNYTNCISKYIEDKDCRWQKDKEKLKVLARKMSKEELVDEVAECWLLLDSYRKRDI